MPNDDQLTILNSPEQEKTLIYKIYIDNIHYALQTCDTREIINAYFAFGKFLRNQFKGNVGDIQKILGKHFGNSFKGIPSKFGIIGNLYEGVSEKYQEALPNDEKVERPFTIFMDAMLIAINCYTFLIATPEEGDEHFYTNDAKRDNFKSTLSSFDQDMQATGMWPCTYLNESPDLTTHKLEEAVELKKYNSYLKKLGKAIISILEKYKYGETPAPLSIFEGTNALFNNSLYGKLIREYINILESIIKWEEEEEKIEKLCNELEKIFRNFREDYRYISGEPNFIVEEEALKRIMEELEIQYRYGLETNEHLNACLDELNKLKNIRGDPIGAFFLQKAFFNWEETWEKERIRDGISNLKDKAKKELPRAQDIDIQTTLEKSKKRTRAAFEATIQAEDVVSEYKSFLAKLLNIIFTSIVSITSFFGHSKPEVCKTEPEKFISNIEKRISTPA